MDPDRPVDYELIRRIINERLVIKDPYELKYTPLEGITFSETPESYPKYIHPPQCG